MNDREFIAGSYYQNNYTQEENATFAQQFDAITREMLSCLDQDLPFDSEEMQQAVKKHFEFCLRFWTPTAETYKALAMGFILPTGYRDSYESYREGLGKYVYDSIVYFADKNLS